MDKSKILLTDKVELAFATPENQSFFFGYYNYSPLSFDGTKLLAHKTKFEGRMAQPSDSVEIGFFNTDTDKWHELGESNAFNWQQGAMLQWLGPDFNSKVIYNAVENNKFVAKIVDVNTHEVRTVPHAIYAVDPHGEYSISLNFERCYWTRAYSYAPIVDAAWNERIPEQDGVVRVDLRTGEVKTIIGLKEFLNSQSISDDGETAHWFEHIMLNFSATRFAFYHRYGNVNSFYTACFTADINGDNIWKHPVSDGESYSHLGWRGDDVYALFTYCKSKAQSLYCSKKTPDLIRSIYRRTIKPLLAAKTQKKVAKTKNFYALTLDMTGIIERIGVEILSRDGHPSFTKDGQYMLSDTYGDELDYRHLYLYDLLKKRVFKLGKFFSTYNCCGWRADLHPRFSYDEKSVIIDSTHNGYHQMVVLDVDWDMVKNDSNF